MIEEVISMPVEFATRSTGEPLSMEVIRDLPTEPELPVSESVVPIPPVSVILPTSRMDDHPMETDREDDQPATMESTVPFTMTTADKSIPEGPIQQEIPSDKPAQDENIQEGITQEEPTRKEPMPSADIPSFEERGLKGQL